MRTTLRSLAVLAILAATGTAVGTTPGFPPTDLAVPQDDVLMEVDVAPDGDATWTIRYRTDLTEENASEVFEAVQRRVDRDRETFLREFRGRMAGTVAAGENATLRQMALANLSVTTRVEQVPRSTGVVAYRFEWRGFADGGDVIRVRDVLGGLELDDGSTLVMRWPDGYDATTVAPAPTERRDRAAVWRGPATFAFDEPRLEATAGDARSQRRMHQVAGGLILMLPVLVVGAVVSRRYGVPRPRRRRHGGTEAQQDVTRDGHVAAEESSPRQPAGETTEDQVTVDELASNEEQVLAVLETLGGRAKQQDVVEELDWTEAKTSQVVTDMHEDGTIDKYRLGRENVLALPDQDPLGGDQAGGSGGDDGEGADGDDRDTDDDRPGGSDR